MQVPRRAVILIALCAVSLSVHAAPPSLINIHGQLLAPAGTPLTGVRAYQVTFYDAETDGNVLGTTLSGTTSLSADGLFNIPVAPPVDILLAPEVWYELGIDTDEPADNDATDDLFPNRVRLFSVPFALQAQEVVAVDADRVGNGLVDNTEFDALDGVSSNIQSQIDAIDTSGIATNASDIADNTAAIALKANSADVYTQAEIDAQQGLQDTEIALKANSADVYTQAEIDVQQGLQDTEIANNANAIALKANSADVYTQAEIDTQQGLQDTEIALKANSADVYTQAEIDAQQATQDTEIALKANSADVYTQAEIDTQQGLQDTAIAAKANSADVYTQAEIDTQQGLQDTAIAAKANSADVYTQAEIDTQQGLQDTAIAAKANSTDVYTQAEIDTQQGLQDTAIAAKANSADVYTQAEIDSQQATQNTAIAAKANSADVFTQAQANTNFVNATGDTMSGALAVGTINEASASAGVTVDGVLLRDGALNLPGNTIEIASAAAPGVTTNKLYNTGGNLFWSGTQLNGGGGGSAEEIIKGANISTYSTAYAFPGSFDWSQDIRHNQSDGSRSAPFPIFSVAKVIQEIRVFLVESETFTGTQEIGVQYTIRKINTGAVQHNVTGVINLTTLTQNTWINLPIAANVVDRTIENDEFLTFYTTTISGTDNGVGDYSYVEEVVVE